MIIIISFSIIIPGGRGSFVLPAAVRGDFKQLPSSLLKFLYLICKYELKPA